MSWCWLWRKKDYGCIGAFWWYWYASCDESITLIVLDTIFTLSTFQESPGSTCFRGRSLFWYCLFGIHGVLFLEFDVCLSWVLLGAYILVLLSFVFFSLFHPHGKHIPENTIQKKAKNICFFWVLSYTLPLFSNIYERLLQRSRRHCRRESSLQYCLPKHSCGTLANGISHDFHFLDGKNRTRCQCDDDGGRDDNVCADCSVNGV